MNLKERKRLATIQGIPMQHEVIRTLTKESKEEDMIEEIETQHFVTVGLGHGVGRA